MGLEYGINVTSLGDRPMRALVSFTFTEKLARQHAQNAIFELFAAASLFRLTGWFLYPLVFIHLRLLKKEKGNAPIIKANLSLYSYIYFIKLALILKLIFIPTFILQILPCLYQIWSNI